MSANSKKTTRSGAKRSTKKAAARKAATPKKSTSKAAKKAPSKNPNGTKRLRPGELDGMVVKWMEENEDRGKVSPGTVATGINRSSGAVANCMGRLAKEKRIRLATKKPKQYDLKVAAGG
ncbi:MAG TPA: hypothetical protein VFJ57_09810 [Solirubrobacterales bacterium]|nr:hypothetical protein [Solirubrobacterales bacterium]